MRYLTNHIIRDLEKKMVILSGPRQSGKTSLAKEILDHNGVYLNWDIASQQKIIRDQAWKKNASLVVFDELHKYLKWKNFLKGVVDEYNNKPPLLVTGSAKLDIFKHEGDALTGRYYHYRLHPIDINESKIFLPKSSAQQRLDHLLVSGGFPEAFLYPDDAERLRKDRLDLVLYEDLRDLTKMHSIRGIKLLIELLRERVGQQLNVSNIAQDIGVSSATIKNWLDILENLYIIFLVPPHSKGLARSIRKEKKVYFYDCVAGSPYSSSGSILENLTACTLIKYCHFMRDTQGKEMQLYYFRDRDHREVDFIVTGNNKVKWCIEVKENDTQLSKNLEYLHKKIQAKSSFQLVKNIKQEKEIRGIKIQSLANWCDQLY